MHKISQRELLDEGFWDSFKKTAHNISNSKIGRAVNKYGIQLGKEMGKIILPKTSENLSKGFSALRAGAKRVGEAGQTMEERVVLWLDEHGYTPTPNQKVKLIKTFPGGDKHFSVKVAEKSSDPDTGETIPGRKFRYPTAIVLFDNDKKIFKRVVLPARNQWIIGNNGVEYWDERAKRGDQVQNQQQNQSQRNP